MAKKNILVDIDFNKNQLLNPVLQNLSEDPSTGVEGQKYFNTTNHIERIYRNGAWQNGSDEYELPAASTNTRGGIKVGSHLNVTDTDVLNADEASTTQKGVVEIATDEEVAIGTSTTLVVTAAQLKAIKDYLDGRIDSLPTPMQFKGTLGSGGTITILPIASADNAGFVYLVISDGTYDSQVAKAGDEFICAKPVGASDYEWILVPSGDEPAQIQADWNQSDNTALDYIKNKPDVASLEDAVEDLQEDVEELQNGYFSGWRTPTSAEWDYIINTRSASTVSGTANARFAKAQINSINGLILLPDVFELPTGITMLNINIGNATASDNTYTISQWETLENAGCIFLPCSGYRGGTIVNNINSYGFYSSTTQISSYYIWYLFIHSGSSSVGILTDAKKHGKCVRLIKENTTGGFSISSTLKADIAKSNLQFHCLNKEWRFAPNAYDVIGNDNSNIAENYNGYIDLFGFGTSGWNSGAVAYQPWSSSMNDNDYIQHDLVGDYKNADWGYNIKKQLQDVAFSGSYNDLSNKPIIPVGIPSGGNAGQVLSKASATDYDVHWNNQVIIYPSAYCTTNATSDDKKASCSLYTLNPNSYVHVLLGTTNTVQSALTLNINSTGAKPIYINGNPSSSTNYTLPAGTYIVFYNGTNYYFRTDGKLTTLNGAFGGSYNDLTNKPAAIPTPTSADEDKLLSVNSSGEYELITIINSELIPY